MWRAPIIPFGRGPAQARFLCTWGHFRSRTQCTFVVKSVHSALWLLNISFSLYWLLPCCNKQYPYEWPAESPTRAPRLWEQLLPCSHSRLGFIHLCWIFLYSLPPPETSIETCKQKTGWNSGGQISPRQSLQQVKVLELNGNLFAVREVWAKIIINPCLRYSPALSYPTNYISMLPAQLYLIY